jgi:hypothetical protein
MIACACFIDEYISLVVVTNSVIKDVGNKRP